MKVSIKKRISSPPLRFLLEIFLSHNAPKSFVKETFGVCESLPVLAIDCTSMLHNNMPGKK